MNLTNVLRNLI